MEDESTLDKADGDTVEDESTLVEVEEPTDVEICVLEDIWLLHVDVDKVELDNNADDGVDESNSVAALEVLDINTLPENTDVATTKGRTDAVAVDAMVWIWVKDELVAGAGSPSRNVLVPVQQLPPVGQQ